MKNNVILLALFLVIFNFTLSSKADEPKPNFQVRWTGVEDKIAEFSHVLTVVNSKTGLQLTAKDFMLVEDRDLANNHFKMYSQVVDGLPVKGKSIRIWATSEKEPQLIQAEAFVESKKAFVQGPRPEVIIDLIQVAKKYVTKTEDPKIREIKSKDIWLNHEAVRMVELKGKRGVHQVAVSLSKQKVVAYQYKEFPQGEIEIPVQVYQIYEELESSGKLMNRIPANLKYIKSDSIHATSDPYSILKTQRFFEEKMDPILGNTEEGRRLGFWSMDYLKIQAMLIRNKIKTVPNTYDNGMVLEGRYATVSLHPDVVNKFSGINFTPTASAQFKPNWIETLKPGTNETVYEMIPGGALLGKPITSVEDAWNRPARRLADHNPTSYINDGFDELQVYYGITTLMDSLHGMGFTDPDLSSRPFNAYLYDPDISMKDNAFYTDDTINFTTYSPKAVNYARDNPTIWHELGHGVMDRLMGDSITLADTGGLSEGMADFVAALVIADVTKSQPFDGSDEFRIINNTGFNLTNEVHDDGEAYGGSMKDLLDNAVKAQGQDGVRKVTDLTLESMRLTRNHPGLTADLWFSHMLFADSLGSNVRKPNEMKDFILSALAGRNFAFNGGPTATFQLMNEGKEVVGGAPGSRQRPIPVTLTPSEKAAFKLKVSLKDSVNYKFQYPVEMKVLLRSGPLQGAIKWDNEDAQPILKTINSQSDIVDVDLAATGVCDFVNREDGSCVDYAYLQIFKPGTKKPVGKKRFYLKMTPKPAA